jgi:type III secretory pathway component EscT
MAVHHESTFAFWILIFIRAACVTALIPYKFHSLQRAVIALCLTAFSFCTVVHASHISIDVCKLLQSSIAPSFFDIVIQVILAFYVMLPLSLALYMLAFGVSLIEAVRGGQMPQLINPFTSSTAHPIAMLISAFLGMRLIDNGIIEKLVARFIQCDNDLALLSLLFEKNTTDIEFHKAAEFFLISFIESFSLIMHLVIVILITFMLLDHFLLYLNKIFSQISIMNESYTLKSLASLLSIYMYTYSEIDSLIVRKIVAMIEI